MLCLTDSPALTMLPTSSSVKLSDSESNMVGHINMPLMYFSEFAESTILTIAHRLRTVIDYDRVCIKHVLKFFCELIVCHS
jgi:ABC-type transport system involved in Fe-S cluster assembly fused permease/ATPase subunit